MSCSNLNKNMQNYFPTQNYTTTTTNPLPTWNPPLPTTGGPVVNPGVVSPLTQTVAPMQTVPMQNVAPIQATPMQTVPIQAPVVQQSTVGTAMAAQDTSWMPETLTEIVYTPAYLRSNIGSLVRVEFLMANSMTDRVGILSDVGASYIVLKSLEGESKIMCDLYSIKFVTIISSQVTNTVLNAYGSRLGTDASNILLTAVGQ